MKYNKLVDIVIVIAILSAVFVGIITMKHYRETASKQIESTQDINFTVFLRGVTLSDGIIPMQDNETTFISIRNVPYSDLKIVNVKSSPKMVIIPANTLNGYRLIQDVSQPNCYDILVTVTDNAKITKDGAVVGGNKIKIGLPITLEGKTYKLSGTVSDIEFIEG